MTTDAVEEVESTGDFGPVRLLEQRKRQCAEDAIAALYEDAERIKRRELEEAVSKLEACGDLDGVQRDIVEGMAEAIVEQLLAVPAKSVWYATDWITIHTALRLFAPKTEVNGDILHADESDLPEVDDAE